MNTRRTLIMIWLMLVTFCLGWVAANGTTNLQTGAAEKPFSIPSVLFGNLERYSPGDHIPEDDIFVFPDEVVIQLDGATWASYEDSNSMDPVLDSGANGIEMKPVSEGSLKVGDIISFQRADTEGLVVHRISNIGYDHKGWFARTKGDNNPSADPGKVRFEDVHGVLVGIIY